MKSSIQGIWLKHFFSLLLIFAGRFQAQEFEVKILLENAHVGELFFACQKGASAGYDRGKDIFCPPGGMGDTGLAWFAAPEADLPTLYKDVKNCVFPQQWTLLVQPPIRKKLVLKWEPEQLPTELDFQLSGSGVDLNMRKTSELTLSAKGTLQITVRKNQPETTDEKK